MNRPKGKEYEFTLTLEGTLELTIDRMNRLFEAGCDDATFGTRCGAHFAMFLQMVRRGRLVGSLSQWVEAVRHNRGRRHCISERRP